MPSDDLIIPDLYDPDVRTAVRWLQEHLPLSDQYLVQLIEAPRELFSAWKRGEETLTISQTQTLENLSAAINGLLSCYAYRRDLLVRVLEFRSANQVHRGSSTPPWVGTSLKKYMLDQGAKGIVEVDAWVQEMKSANS
jgi:hypothetical protein